MEKYKMLDLFSGEEGACEAMKEDKNWEVITVDFIEKFNPTICKDILELKPKEIVETTDIVSFDLIWASPPCQAFSMGSMPHYWNKKNEVFLPNTDKEGKADFVEKSIRMVYRSLRIIDYFEPDFWFLENPRATLHKFIGEPECYVTYCQYGKDYMKPTNLWGKHPDSFVPKNCSYGDTCHIKTPRGSKTGIQGLDSSEERAKIPYELSKEVKLSVENPESRNKLEAFV